MDNDEWQPGTDFTQARAVMAETHSLVHKARATAIATRERVRHLRELIAETQRILETSRTTLARASPSW